MKVTAHTNGKLFEGRNKRYFKRFAERGDEATRGEMRRLLRLVAKITPPKSLGQGQRSVERDLRKAVQPLNIRQFPGDGKFNVAMRSAIRTRNIAKAQSLIDRITGEPLKGARVLNFSKGLHLNERGSRGRVLGKWRKVLTLDVVEWRNRLRLLKSRVGMALGGWANAMTGLNVPVKSWASRHSSRGAYLNSLRGLNGYLTATNRSAWAGDNGAAREVRNALKIRESILAKKLALESSLAQGEAFR